jgi:hypothetical protein
MKEPVMGVVGSEDFINQPVFASVPPHNVLWSLERSLHVSVNTQQLRRLARAAATPGSLSAPPDAMKEPVMGVVGSGDFINQPEAEPPHNVLWSLERPLHVSVNTQHVMRLAASVKDKSFRFPCVAASYFQPVSASEPPHTFVC